MLAASVLALLLADTPAPPPPKLALDVVVHDPKGQAVDRLTPSDLIVTESGRALAVESVRFMRAAPAEPRALAIFLDEYHVQPGPDAERVRDRLLQFVRDTLSPADRLAVLKPLDSLLDISVTTDRAAALAAIQSFTPRANDLSARTAFERSYMASAPEQVVASRAQIAGSSLAALTRALGALGSGRKTLIVVSDGFAIRPRGPRGDAGLAGLDTVAASANRAQVSIYPIVGDGDLPGAGAAAAALRERLARVAADTAGAVVPAGRIADGLSGALNDASGYYEVTLADPLPASMRLHVLSISTRRADLVVRARSAYGAPVDLSATASPMPSTASRLPPIARRTSPLIRPWFGMSRAADGDTEVRFAWEPAPRPAGERVRGLPPSRIVLTVIAEDGRTLFEGPVAAATSSMTGSTVPPSRIAFTSRSGRVLVQMAIEDAASGVLDRDVRDLLVEPFEAGVTLGTPEVFRVRTVRERDAVAANLAAAPTTARLFSRAERLLVRVPLSAASAGPSLTARLVSDLGGVIRPLEATWAAGRSDLLQFDIPLAALAAGGYAIELSVRENGREARERLAFRVTP